MVPAKGIHDSRELKDFAFPPGKRIADVAPADEKKEIIAEQKEVDLNQQEA